MTSQPDPRSRLTNALPVELKSFARLVQAPAVFIQDLIIGSVARVVRRKSFVREHCSGDDPASGSEKAAVYVHFDSKGVVHEYVVYQLRELLDAGFRITFVSNAPIFPEGSRGLVRPFCKDIIWRHNIGYDFGAYKDGISALGPPDHLDTLVLMNDSIYGPFWKLSDTISKIDRTRYDFWGIVDSWEQQRYHLQSFFLVLFSETLQSPAFKAFWRRYPYVNNKKWVIRNGEIELTQALAEQRLRSGALASYWSIAEAMKNRLAAPPASESTTDSAFRARLETLLIAGRPLNSMHFFWDVLINEYRCPFIKRELITANPAGIPNARQYTSFIHRNTPYDVSLIELHKRSLLI